MSSCVWVGYTHCHAIAIKTWKHIDKTFGMFVKKNVRDLCVKCASELKNGRSREANWCVCVCAWNGKRERDIDPLPNTLTDGMRICHKFKHFHRPDDCTTARWYNMKFQSVELVERYRTQRIVFLFYAEPKHATKAIGVRFYFAHLFGWFCFGLKLILHNRSFRHVFQIDPQMPSHTHIPHTHAHGQTCTCCSKHITTNHP